MRKNYLKDAQRIDAALVAYEAEHGSLPGIRSQAFRDTLIEQIIDSEQRVRYTDRLLAIQLDPTATDPRSDGFHPLKASIIHHRAGDFDEAIWMVYLFVHFGRHLRGGWQYIRDTYGAFGEAPSNWWTWERTAEDPIAFRNWLHDHQDDYRRNLGGFGNHRKYLSLNAWGGQGTGAAIASYVEWVLSAGGDHRERFESLRRGSPEETFSEMYDAMKPVVQFGRIARFDYLTMLGKLRLAEVCPPHSYLVGATGPLMGARLLLRGDPSVGSARELQEELARLGASTGLSADVLEDSVCNWQKSPGKYLRFSA